MRFLFYTHSLVSDWNNGNAHFQRGILRELIARGHEARALEPADGWSRANLMIEEGASALRRFADLYPELRSDTYIGRYDHEAELAEADVVVVHEWTDPQLIARIGRARKRGGRFTLLFHDTHHRAVSAQPALKALDLSGYDAVLAFGDTLRQTYEQQGWGRRAFTWHEAADTRLFRPLADVPQTGDLVWVGNWGDGERSAEIEEFLIAPAEKLGLRTSIHGVRYPREARQRLAEAGIAFRGYAPNTDVPRLFAEHRVTVHIPRRPYARQLPGIPTIRVFEALAAGIPLVTAPWTDSEHLFRPGADYLVARSGEDMAKALFSVVSDPALARSLARSGRETILRRHTVAHRVDELMTILDQIGARVPPAPSSLETTP